MGGRVSLNVMSSRLIPIAARDSFPSLSRRSREFFTDKEPQVYLKHFLLQCRALRFTLSLFPMQADRHARRHADTWLFTTQTSRTLPVSIPQTDEVIPR